MNITESNEDVTVTVYYNVMGEIMREVVLTFSISGPGISSEFKRLASEGTCNTFTECPIIAKFFLAEYQVLSTLDIILVCNKIPPYLARITKFKHMHPCSNHQSYTVIIVITYVLIYFPRHCRYHPPVTNTNSIVRWQIHFQPDSYW